MTVQSVRATFFPNVFSLLMRTALELLPNLYFLRDMESVRDVNNDLGTVGMRCAGRSWRVLPDGATASRLGDILKRVSFKKGGKHRSPMHRTNKELPCRTRSS